MFEVLPLASNFPKCEKLVAFCLLALGGLPAFAQGDGGGVGVAGVDAYFANLISRCAPTVHPETMAAVISAESRGHQFAIADAGPVRLPWAQRKSMVRSFYPDSLESAVATASALIRDGHTVSLGLAQVNDRNLARYGLSVRDVFDPCTNVAVGGKILTDFYVRAVKTFGPTQAALFASISAYNSGDWVRGAKDGYVGLVYKQVGRPLAIAASSSSSKAVHVRKLKQQADGLRGYGQARSVFPTFVPVNHASGPGIREGRAFAMSSGAFVVKE